MEGSESTISRVGRAVWTVWGYLTGTVGRYLRPEVTNQEAHNVHFKQDETVSISKGYKELQIKEEDKERTKTKTERKTIEDLQYPGVSVRAAAVQWEKSNIVCDGHEVKDKSKHTCISSKVIDKRAQKDKEKTLDNKNESQKTPNKQFIEQEDSPASIVADVKNQERTFSGGEEDDFNVEKCESKQDQTKKPEEKEKRVEFEEIGKEEYTPWLDQGLTLEVDLNFEKGENSKEQEGRQKRKEDIANIAREEENDTDRGLFEDDVIVHGLLAKELYSSYSYFTESNENSQKEKGEEKGVEIMRRDDKTEEGTIKHDLVEQELLANEADLNVKKISTNQEQGGKKEEKVETGEEMFECEFVEQRLLAKEADLNLESNVFQERGEKEGKEVKSADEIKRREKYETEEEQIKGEVIDKDLLANESDLHFEISGIIMDQRIKTEEEGVDEMSRRENNETEEEPIKSEFIDKFSEADINGEGNKTSQKQGRADKEEVESANEISRRENDETEDEPVKSEFIDQFIEADLNVEGNANNEQQGMTDKEEVEEVESADEISRRENYETEEEPIESEFFDQGLLTTDVDLNVKIIENSQEQEEGKEEKGVEIIRRENDDTGKYIFKCEFVEQGLLTEKADSNLDRNVYFQEQERKGEKEVVSADEILRSENDDTEDEPVKSEFIDQLIEADLNVEGNANNEQQGRTDKEEVEEVESADEIIRRENYETEKEPVKSEFIDQLIEADLNVEGAANIKQQDRTDKEEVEEVESADEIIRRENYETEEEPIKSEFIDQDLLTTEADLNVERNENNQEQGLTDKEEKVKNVKSADEIPRGENYETEEEPIESEFFDQGLLTTVVDLNVERIENSQEQGEGKEEKGVEIIRHENDDTGKDVFKCEFVEQGLLTKEADSNLETNVYIQEQERKEEMEVVSADEIIRRDNDQTEKEPVESEFIGQGLLANKSDLNVEINVISVQQRTKSKDEGVEVSYDKTEEELSEFIDQFIESDLTVEGNGNKQEQRRTDKEEETEEVESADEIMRKERDENEEEPIKSEFTDQPLLAMEADLNVENNESNPEQGGNEEEEGVEIIMRENDETRESTIKYEFFEQGLLAKEADLNVEKHGNSQTQRRNSQVKEEEKYVDDSLPEYEGTEDKPFKTELIVQEPEEQANLCGMQDTAMVQVVLEENIIGYVNDQDNTELYVVEESNHVKTKDENQEGNSQMMNEAHQASTWEGKAPLNEGLKLVENATLLQEKEAIEVNNEETKKETEGKENDGYKNEFSAFEKFTGIDTVEKQKACDTEKKETLNKIEVIVEYVETESQQLERTQIETAEGCSSTRFEDEDNSSAVTVKLQKLEQSKEQKATSEVALKVDRKHIDDAAYDHNGSQQPAALTKPEAEVVITQPEKMTGSQTETAETTSKCKEEVAAIDVIKSAERETSLHEQPIDTEVAIQEIMRPCLFVQQGPLLEESADNRINELSLVKSVSETQSVPFKQLSEFAVESVDEMQTNSMQNLDKCSKEAKLSSPKQTAEWFETLSEATVMKKDEQKFEQATDKLIQEDATLGDQINQNECTVQDSATDTSLHRLQLDFSDSLYLPEMQSDSQKDTEEQERTDEEENGLSDEVRHNTSGLTNESDDSKWKSMREMETTERKENESELESHDETFENMNVEIPNVAWKCEKELTEMIDIETMVVSTHGEMESVKKMEQPFTEQETDKCELVFPECKESKVMNKEHEKVEHGKSVVDCKEDVEQGGRPGLKRPFEKIAEGNDMDKPCVLTGLSLPSQASSLDFTVQKSKIAVKNPLVRPPKDPRSLINTASVEPLIPPRPLQPSFPKKSHIEGASVPSKGVIGFKLPGLGAGFPALRKTEAGKKIRDGEEAGSETSHVQKSIPDSQSADDMIKQEIKPPKPKWTPPRQPGMGSPLMMAELKSKLKKPE